MSFSISSPPQETLNCRQCGQINNWADRRCGSCKRSLALVRAAANRAHGIKPEPSEWVAATILVLGVFAGAIWLLVSVISFLSAPTKDPWTAEDRRRGLNCLFLGYNVPFVDAVKARLRDPDSFEHEKTLIAPVDKQGRHAIIMQYRAKNGFGGYNSGTAIGSLDHATCNVTAVEMTDG
jgi:hypothetical protein